jgi:hypothetical protein
LPTSSSRHSAESACIASLLIAALLLAGPAHAGPPFRTDDPDPGEYQHFEFDGFSLGTKTNRGWNVSLPGLEANYTALPNMQLHVVIAQGYSAPPEGRSGFAFGDVELGVKYRFLNPGEDDWFPQVATFPLIEAPSGNQKLGFSTGHTQYFLPIWLQKDFDPWTIYGGGGYWINPGAGNRNYGFMGVALWRKLSDRLNVGVEVFHQTSPAIDVKASTGFNVGATYDFTENWHLLVSAGTGLQNQSSTNQFSYYAGLQLTL